MCSLIFRPHADFHLAASRATQRENYERHQQRVKRKAEAEERGNASQPDPLPSEPKHRKVTINKPEDILGKRFCQTRVSYLSYSFI
jgi:hypothetical protein